jgi:hypothetical protein
MQTAIRAAAATFDRWTLDEDILELNLEPIAFLVALTERWDLERIDATELEYRCFLQLVRDFPDRPIAPSRDVDTFWHCHVLTLGLYLEHCQKLFGRPLLHYPFSGALGEADAARQHARFEVSSCLMSELVDRVRSTQPLNRSGVTP